jgi:small subunit ribosomal protein S17e
MHNLFINSTRIKGYGDWLGRIRTKMVKNMSKKLVEHYPEKFNDNFENNKKVLEEMQLFADKPVRNKVAGYIVTVVEKRNVQSVS